MSHVKKQDGKIVLTCDCKDVHTITLDENETLQVSTIYHKKQKREENAETKETEPTGSIESWFD